MDKDKIKTWWKWKLREISSKNMFFLLFQVDFQLLSDKGETSSFIANGEWALLGDIYLPTDDVNLLNHFTFQMFLPPEMKWSTNVVQNPILTSPLQSRYEGEHCTTSSTSLCLVFSLPPWPSLASHFRLTRGRNCLWVSLTLIQYSGTNNIYLGVNLLLAIVLFSTIVGDMLPVTNATPLIGD